MLCDKDPAVMGASLHLLHDMIEAHPPCAPVPERACAVHLRLGDVVENTMVSVEAMWNGALGNLTADFSP